MCIHCLGHLSLLSVSFTTSFYATQTYLRKVLMTLMSILKNSFLIFNLEGFACLFLVELGFELRASGLLDRHSLLESFLQS
jgi:hypothetical protein